MSPIQVTPKIEELRRLKKILDKQIGSRTAELSPRALRQGIDALHGVEELLRGPARKVAACGPVIRHEKRIADK